MASILRGVLVVAAGLVLVGFFGWVFWLAVITDLGCREDEQDSDVPAPSFYEVAESSHQENTGASRNEDIQ